jgi:plastocyanin
VTVSTQVPSIFAYIGLMLIISIPATVLAVASYRGVQYLKPMAVIFISAAIVGGTTFYAFGLVTPKAQVPAGEEQEAPPPAEEPAARPANTISARILPGASAEGNPDYDPDPLTVNQGDGVEWTNEDNTPHTVTSKQEGVFDSGIIDAAAKWLLNTADLQPAEYEYYCTLHPFMGATLVVTGGAAANQTADNATTAGAAANQTADNATTAGAAANQMAPNSRAASPLVTSVSIANGASVPTNEEFFAPDDVQVTVGSMVTWKNDDTASHTVTSGTVQNNTPTPDGRFDSGILNAGDSFPFVFDKAGEYPYYCTIHPWMTAKVTAS